MYKRVLGYDIFSGSKEELYEELIERRKVHIISGNSEVLYKGIKNYRLNKIYKQRDSLIIPDGGGTIVASKILNRPIKYKIAGIELMEYIIKRSVKCNLNIYLLGAEEEVIKLCERKLKKVYGEKNIVGCHNGYFDINNCDYILNEINYLNSDILFVAMGNPKQEIFIDRYKERLNCNIFMGVGGSFDVLAGKSKRAPRLFLKLNLEWLYRTIKEPKRILRLGYISLFLKEVVKEKREKR